MSQFFKKLMIIFICCFNFILNSPSTINIKSNPSINEIKGIFPESNIKNGSMDNIDISSFIILGFDKYIYDINNKIIKFNFYFFKDNNNSFPNRFYLYLNINYKDKIIRYLQNDNNFKSTCDLISDNNTSDQIIKYECKLKTNGKEINNIKSLDIVEYNSQRIKIQNLCFLYILYKDNIKNAKEDIFNKQIYILKNSFVNNNNEKEFNITGDLNKNIDKLNINQILLQFHPAKNNSNIKNSTCYIINLSKTNENKLKLNCISNKSFYTNIEDGYSKLNNSILFIIFSNDTIKININEVKSNVFNFNMKRLNHRVLIIIIFIIICIFIVIFFLVWEKKRKRKKVEWDIYNKIKEIKINNTNIGVSELTTVNNLSTVDINKSDSKNINWLTIQFISADLLINTYISCNRTDNFSYLEEKLYQRFPELRYRKLLFIHKNKYIKRSSTIKNNKISDDDKIIIYEIQ